MAFLILSLSGGGVRGIFQAVYLREIAQDLPQPLYSSFDLIAGTSTGSILAFAVALDRDLNRIADLYRNHANVIFAPRRTAYVFGGPVYSDEPLRSALNEVFGTAQLKDCLRPVVITAAQLNEFGHRVFTTLERCEGLTKDATLSVVDVVMASCAAPTYFPPVQPVGEERTYVDGGVWANNPALIAVIEAYRRANVPLSEICLVSVGNGQFPTGAVPTDFNKLRPASPAAIRYLFDMMFSTQSTAADDFAQTLIGSENMLQVNANLAEFISLHDVESAVTKLPPLAEASARKTFAKLNQLISRRRKPAHLNESSKLRQTVDTLETLYLSGLKNAERLWLHYQQADYRYKEREVEYVIEKDAALTFTERLTVCGSADPDKNPIFISRHGLTSNQMAPGLGSVRFTVKRADETDETKEVVHFVTTDDPAAKRAVVLYLPPIQSPDDCRKVTVSCQWPGFWRPLFEKGQDTFKDDPCSAGTIEKMVVRIIAQEGVPDLRVENRTTGEVLSKPIYERGQRVWRWERTNVSSNVEYRFLLTVISDRAATS